MRCTLVVRTCVVTTILALGSLPAAADDTTAPPKPERPIPYGAGATLALFTTRTTDHAVDPGMPTQGMQATGVGVTLRYQAGYSLTSGSFGVSPMFAFETGLGYNSLDGQYTGPLWFLLRLEFGLEASARVADDIGVALRASFFGHYNATREVGASDDLWALKAMARYQRTTLALGVKSPFQDVPFMGGGGNSYLTAGVQHQLSASHYAGVEYMRFAGANENSDFASHEVRVFVGLW